MTGRVIKDYFTAFRWSNFKEKVAHFAYLVVYFFTVFPVLVGFFETWESALIYVLMMIPTIHILNSGSLHIMKMPKMMYMVPLTNDMKKEYIVKSAIFRICFCSLLGMICTLPLVFMGICRVITYVVMVYDYVIFALLLCGMNERYGIEERDAWQEARSDCRGLIQGIDMIITVISLFGIACMLSWDANEGKENVYENLLFIIPAILFQLPLTIKHMKYWNTAVEKALNYERSFDK